MSADRLACRMALITLLDTITTFAEVYDGEPFTTGGISPVAMVISQSTETGPGETMTGAVVQHRIQIDLYWKRTTSTETDVDTLSAAVFALLKANRGANAAWSSMEIDGASQMGYVFIDKIDYRLERIPVVVW